MLETLIENDEKIKNKEKFNRMHFTFKHLGKIRFYFGRHTKSKYRKSSI
jgi:hypothetical protein